MVIGEISKGQGQALVLPKHGAGICRGDQRYTEGEIWDPGCGYADGPAGLRLIRSYEVDKKDGKYL